jgi:PAS domain S-box-containing protein
MDWNKDRGKRAILIIDKDRDGAEKLKNLLNENAYQVYTAGKLKEARRLAEEKSIIVALLCMGRSDLDSEKIIKNLRRSKDDAQIPVIVILESFVEDLVASALKAGAVDYLTWPVDSQELARRVGVYARLKEDQNSVTKSLERYREHFGKSDAGLFFTSKGGELLECNEALIKMLGYDRKDELLHRNVEETIYFDPKERKRFRIAIEEKGMVKDFRVTFRRKGGDPISILISGQVVRDDDGDIIGYRGKNIPLMESGLTLPRKGLLKELLPRLSEGFYSLFSATELLGQRYEKLDRLGLGSFGEVWKVRNMEKDPPEVYVAKIPLSKKLNAKFEKEARILYNLAGHAGVPEICEVIEEKSKVVLIQEFVIGKTLFEVIERELEETEIESVMIQLIDVVAHAHDKGIIHRDIKPENVMVKPDGAIKLLDFGAAKELKDIDMSSTVTGSRPFMSPEQIMGKSQRRSDVWALGVVMYVLYTGMFPFYHDVEKVLMDMILEVLPSPPSKFNKELNPEIERIILKCLEKSPESRYTDARALQKDITGCFPNYGKNILPLY